MNALELQNRLEGLGERLQKFFNAYREMRSQNEELKKENAQLKSSLDNKNREEQNFQNKRKIGKLVDEMDGEELDSNELKNLLDRYIEEIDHCIKILKE